MFEQVDEEVHRQMIIGHQRDENGIPKGQGYFTTLSGILRKKKDTRGWDICFQWKDVRTDWVDLKYLKESHPVDIVQYVVGSKIDYEPTFAW